MRYENDPLHLDVVDRYLRRMGDKRFQTRLRRVWNRFIPHESQLSIYHNQGVVDSLSRSPIKMYSNVKNTAIPACGCLSRRPHPIIVVPRSCKRRCHCYLWCRILYATHQDSSPINIQIYQTQFPPLANAVSPRLEVESSGHAWQDGIDVRHFGVMDSLPYVSICP